MKHIKIFSLTFILLIGFVTLQAQKITNIQPQLKGNVIEIAYDISEANFNQKFTVELYVSNDGGKTYRGPMTVIDDNKKELTEGTNTLVWDVFKDLNSLDKELHFDIRAKVIEEKIAKHFFVQYSAGALLSSTDYIIPFGFRIGMLSKVGFYAAGYFNTFQNATYNFDGETMEEDIFYEFTDKALYPRMIITGGLTFQVGWKSYLYAGAGFATKKYYKQINELNLDGSIKTTEQWTNITAFNESGVEIEAGTIIKLNKVNLSFGLSAFNFKHLGANVGFGLTF